MDPGSTLSKVGDGLINGWNNFFSGRIDQAPLVVIQEPWGIFFDLGSTLSKVGDGLIGWGEGGGVFPSSGIDKAEQVIFFDPDSTLSKVVDGLISGWDNFFPGRIDQAVEVVFFDPCSTLSKVVDGLISGWR